MPSPPPPNHSHAMFAAPRESSQQPRWALENVFDFLDDPTLCRTLRVCRGWRATGTTGAWASKAWAARGDAAVAWAAARGAASPEDRCVARALAAEAARDHCCGRGRFLGLAYAPACQRRRVARLRRREVEAAARRWRDERAPVEAAARRAAARLRWFSGAALVVVTSSLGAPESCRLAFAPSRVLWRASRVLSLAHAPLAESAIAARFESAATWRDAARSWRDAMPLVHAALSPEALDLRRYAFFTSVVLLVLHCALLFFWWRFLWYALGAAFSGALGLESLDVASRLVDLRDLEDRSEARFSWLRAVAAERDEALYVVNAEDDDSREAAGLLPAVSPLRVSALFHHGGRAPPPPNPYRGADRLECLACDDGRRSPSPPPRAPRSKRPPRTLASIVGDLLALHRLPLVVLCLSSLTLVAALALVVVRRAEDAGGGASKARLVGHYAVDAAVILASSLYQDVACFALAPFKVAASGLRALYRVLA